ncbi:AraC family transcriptional regulator [Spirosoma sp. BT702]|uniref:AraC family transcriptional regulator n=1 Tax=Spirosoma profusum TaxID=2771354 RepID=A0A927AVS9_9BACT|nr:helix-turn-helix domain-containing protein [Spirosoma profusum]MBD2705363.1 AraC family transcriptional regulator [Spirosoma profusum]
MIIFDYRPPSPALREYVRQYQIVGLAFQPEIAVPVKPYWPRPENCLSFYPRGGDSIEPLNGLPLQNPRSTLNGQHSGLIFRQPPHEFVLFQVVFQPGALFRLTGLPSCELTNTFVDAEALLPAEIRLVNERLNGTDNHLEMIQIVEAFLSYLIRRQDIHYVRNHVLPIDKVSQFLLNSTARINPSRFSRDWPGLDWLANQACLSTKQFYNLFLQRTGVSPKLYARIIRFDQTIKLKNACPQKDWLTIALEMGYYDYQHMVRDFKEFTSLTPTDFILKEDRAPERSFGNAET